jgi:hypothetical protein
VAPARSKSEWDRPDDPPGADRAAQRSLFSQGSHAYAAARPGYPVELFEWVASRCEQRELAWDCATGNGQAARGLSSRFERVCATDISFEQVSQAKRASGVAYIVCAAERTPFHDATFDLVAVAQALHWLDLDGFWPEVVRVARPGALFAAWGYDGLESTSEVDRLVMGPFLEIVAPFWAQSNRLLWNGYRSEEIRFPFERIEVPSLSLELDWSAAQLLAYVETWSAYKRCLLDPIAGARLRAHRAEAQAILPAGTPLRVRMPLTLVAGRVEA